MSVRRRFIALLLAIALGLTGCGAGGQAEPEETLTPEVSEPEEVPEPGEQVEQIEEDEVAGEVEHLFMTDEELAALPDPVASWGENEISREEFLAEYQEQADRARQFGVVGDGDMDSDQFTMDALHTLMDTQLALDAAFAEGIEVSGEEHAAKTQEIADEMGYDSVEQLIETLLESGNDEQDLVDAITQQVMIDKLIDSRMRGVAPSDAELRAHYETLNEQVVLSDEPAEDSLPEFEAIRDTLFEELRAENYTRSTHG